MRIVIVLLLLSTLTVSIQAQANEADRFVDITAGSDVLCGIRGDGSVECGTTALYSRYDFPQNYPAMASIATGGSYSCGVTLQGDIRCWGDNGFGQLNAPTDVSNFVSVSVSSGFHSCGLTDQNRILCWGLNTNGQASPPNDGFGFTKVLTDYQSACGLRIDGHIECWGGGALDDPTRVYEQGPYAEFLTEQRGGCYLSADGEFACGNGSTDGLLTGQYQDVVFDYPYVCGLKLSGALECVQEPGTFASENPADSLGGNYVRLLAMNNGICTLDTAGVIECVDVYRTGLVLPGSEREIPMPMRLAVSIYSDTNAELTWQRIQHVSIGTISNYEVFRDGELLAVTEGTSYYDDGLMPGVDYRYAVRAVSFDNVRSEFSDEIVFDTSEREGASSGGDYTVPARAGEPAEAVVHVYGNTLHEIVWNRPASSKVAGYEIRRNGTFIGFTRGVSYMDEGVSGGGCYLYEVLAVDEDGDIQGVVGVLGGSRC